MIYELIFFNEDGSRQIPETTPYFENMEPLFAYLAKMKYYRLQELASGKQLTELRQTTKNRKTALVHIYTEHPDLERSKYLHTFEFVHINP